MRKQTACVRHIEEWGAKAIPRSEAHPKFVKRNTRAINKALKQIKGQDGVELRFGPGVYWTNGPVGLEMDEDTSVNVTIRGCAYYPTMIRSTNMAEPCVRFHTTSGNIRGIIMENITLRGGKHNLSLHKAAYNRFNNILFWAGNRSFQGAITNTEWCIHSFNGQQNQFNNCWFYETGIVSTDSALLWRSHYETFNNCTYGEAGGGIVVVNGTVAINGGTGYGTWYRGNKPHNWLEKDENDNQLMPLGWMEDDTPPAFLSNISGNANVNGLTLGLGKVFVTLQSAYSMIINGCMITSGRSPTTPPGQGFEGFINIPANSRSKLALAMTGNIFTLPSNPDGADTGYIIQETSSTATPNPFALKDCVVANNIFTAFPNSSIVPLDVSAPTLIDPDNNNIVANTIKNNQGV